MKSYILRSWTTSPLPDDLLSRREEGGEIFVKRMETKLIVKPNGKRGPSTEYREVPTGTFMKVIHLTAEEVISLSERFDIMIQHKDAYSFLWLDTKGRRFSVR